MKRTLILTVCLSTILGFTGLSQTGQGQIDYDVIFKEQETTITSITNGIRKTRKEMRKKGTDYSFSFSFSGNKARIERRGEFQEPIPLPNGMTVNSQTHKKTGPRSGSVTISGSMSVGGTASTSSVKDEKTDLGLDKDSNLVYDEVRAGYYDFQKEKFYGESTILKQEFLVESPLPYYPIPLTLKKEKKEILGYTCKKATLEVGEDVFLSIWYTNELKAPSFVFYNGIEGAILQIESEDKEITATNIDLKKQTSENFDLPSEMKVIDVPKYRDLKREEGEEIYEQGKKFRKGN